MGAQSWRVAHTLVSFTSRSAIQVLRVKIRKTLLLTEDGESKNILKYTQSLPMKDLEYKVSSTL